MKHLLTARWLVIVLLLGVTLLFLRTPGAEASVDVAEMSGGWQHTCGVWDDGRLRCWGANPDGQLGDGSTEPSAEPVDVAGGGTWQAVSASERHTCGVTASGVARCWGHNGGGRLGNGSTERSETPVDVCAEAECTAPLSGVVSIAAGSVHTCAALTNGSVLCWGANLDGQLGSDPVEVNASSTPIPVAGVSGVTQVSAGTASTCALTDAGAVFCWGSNIEGQIGDNHECGDTRCESPQPVAGLGSGVDQISVGERHACALTDAGAVLCWGRNFRGQVGDGTMGGTRLVPTQTVGLESGVTAVSVGGGFRGHGCALLTNGTLRCWGANGSGQVGDGTDEDRDEPVPIPDLANVVHIAAGEAHMCAITGAGVIYCWGNNSSNQYGEGTDEFELSPVATTLGKIESTMTGDVNCDDVVDPIDAALILQFSAGLLTALPCQDAADVNGDGVIDPIDAALVLQYSAGLLTSL